MVVSFNVSYAAVDALQIVTLQEQIESGGTLGGSPVGLINISSSYGKGNNYKTLYKNYHISL